jgi:MoaA/NifB/PqqE/SkfB family radical SAM enzyme
MKNLVKVTATHPDLLKIYYDLGNTCNYKCWYCFPGSNDGDVAFPNPDIVKVNLTKLVNYYIDNKIVKEVEVHLLGGEPTLWRHLGDVAEYVKANTTNCHIEVTTNASRTIRWWEEYGHLFRNVSISVHHEFTDVDHIIKVAEVLYKKNVLFHTNVLFDHNNWDKCMDNYNKLMASKIKWPVIVKPIHINGVTTFTDKQTAFFKKQLKRWPGIKQWFKYLSVARKRYYAHYDDGSVVKSENPNYWSINGENHFKGWECSLGKTWLFISKDGMVSGSCRQNLYGLPFTYNLNDPNFARTFKPKIVPIICHTDICVCSGEAALPKRKL